MTQWIELHNHGRTVGEAIQILKDSKPDSIAIVDADGKYVGFADSDGLMKLSSPDALLSEIIPSIVAAPGVGAEDSLYDAIKKISDSKIMELPVISEENVVVGTVSMSGIMEAYDQKLADSDDVRD